MMIDFFLKGHQELERDGLGSDEEIQYQLSHVLYCEIITKDDKRMDNYKVINDDETGIKVIESKDTSKQKRKGAYFNYLNTTSLDLTRF